MTISHPRESQRSVDVADSRKEKKREGVYRAELARNDHLNQEHALPRMQVRWFGSRPSDTSRLQRRKAGRLPQDPSASDRLHQRDP